MSKLLISLLLLFAFGTVFTTYAADDGIPDNCQYPYGAYYRQQVFPRYEPQNRRLMLVDWDTGADVGALGTNLDDTLIRGWSGDCRYLAVATGDSQSRATAVYDAVNLSYVGDVPGARIVPHPITWGPDDFLMVEGRNGAVLWNVSKNIQYHLHVGFNTTTYRNFSRLRWDTDHQQLVADLANGGRIVYDLTTGQATIASYSGAGELVLGGQRFTCIPDHGSERGGAEPSSWLSLLYAKTGGVYSVGWDSDGTMISLQTLEANAPALPFSRLGWSINCRYIAASITSATQKDSYDTVIWDVLNQRRVGTFPGAHDIDYRMVWDTAEKNVLIQTHDGAYLWNLETGTHTLVNDQVQQPSANCQYDDCQPLSFYHVYWDAGRQQMLGVPVQATNTVVAYDVNTGAEVTRYTVAGATAPIQFMTSNDSRLLLMIAGSQATLWDRSKGASISFDLGFQPDSDFHLLTNASMSTDDHFLAINADKLQVWNLSDLSSNGSPVYTYNEPNYSYDPIAFVNGDTLDDGYYAPLHINVVTGAVSGGYPPGSFDANGQSPQSFSAAAGAAGTGKLADPDQPQCPIAAYYDKDTRQLLVHDLANGTQRVIESNLNPVRKLLISPDCQTIYTDVERLDTSLPYDETPGNEEYRYDKANELIFWDAASGQRITAFDDELLYNYSEVWWNPDGNRALISTSYDQYYLINPAARSIVPVTFQDSNQGYLPSDMDSYWDSQRGIVLVAGYGEVFAIDMNSGRERLRFPALETKRGGCYFGPDSGCGMGISGAWVFVYGNDDLSVWNMDTLQHTTLPVASGGNGSGALISPDGRYLVVSRSAVRVWDLTHLPSDLSARTPIATYGVGDEAVLSTRFVDNTTLEVVTQTATDTAITRYDVATGRPLK